jgi:hypothetical protein
MTHMQIMLWLCVGAYGAHVLEEFVFDWRSWSQQVLDLPHTLGGFLHHELPCDCNRHRCRRDRARVSFCCAWLPQPNAHQRHFHACLSFPAEERTLFAWSDHCGAVLLASWNLHHARRSTDGARNRGGLCCRSSTPCNADRVPFTQTEQLFRPDAAILSPTNWRPPNQPLL